MHPTAPREREVNSAQELAPDHTTQKLIAEGIQVLKEMQFLENKLATLEGSEGPICKLYRQKLKEKDNELSELAEQIERWGQVTTDDGPTHESEIHDDERLPRLREELRNKKIYSKMTHSGLYDATRKDLKKLLRQLERIEESLKRGEFQEPDPIDEVSVPNAQPRYSESELVEIFETPGTGICSTQC